MAAPTARPSVTYFYGTLMWGAFGLKDFLDMLSNGILLRGRQGCLSSRLWTFYFFLGILSRRVFFRDVLSRGTQGQISGGVLVVLLGNAQVSFISGK